MKKAQIYINKNYIQISCTSILNDISIKIVTLLDVHINGIGPNNFQ